MKIIPYSTSNFKPLILHGADVSPGIISLLSKGPSFSLTPLDPPDLATLEEDLLDWRQRMRWAYLFRNKTLQENPQADISSRTQFTKPPWYSRTDKLAPIASEEVELFLALVRKTVLSPIGFSNFLPNISSNESSA